MGLCYHGFEVNRINWIFSIAIKITVRIWWVELLITTMPYMAFKLWPAGLEGSLEGHSNNPDPSLKKREHRAPIASVY